MKSLRLAVLTATSFILIGIGVASARPVVGTPVINLTPPNPMHLPIGGTFIEPGYAALDSFGLDITASTTVSGTVNTAVAGTTTLTYSVTDSVGASASATRDVVVDPAAPPPVGVPSIALNGANPFDMTVGGAFSDPGATANDTVDGNITGSITVTGAIDPNTVGNYTLTYSVTNSGGVSASTTRTVNVNAAPTPPVVPPPGGGGGGGGSSFFGGGTSTPLLAAAAAAPAPVSTCPLLNSFLRYGAANDPSEVAKLQSFLKNTESLDIDVNGSFDAKTLAGVNAFQAKYLSDVMGPWGVSRTSGYVYITTKKKINQIACDTAFVITPDEQAIIDAYKSSLLNTGTPGALPLPGTVEGTTTVPTTTEPLIGQLPAGNENVGAAAAAPASGGVMGFFRWLFGIK